MAETARRWPWRIPVMAAVIGMCVPLAPSASAASAQEVPTAVEAWFRTSPVGGDEDPVCSTPAGCLAEPVAPAPPYPEDTLHVGATSGRPDAVTYVEFATGTLPTDVRLTGGTAVFPVAAAEDGTLAADTAELRACLLTEPFEPAAGEPAEDAPQPDCDTSVPASYVAEGDGPTFEVDLARFVGAWDRAGAVPGLALVPTADGTGTWHVAFSGRERDQDGAAPPITATLTYEEASSEADGDSTFGSSLFTDDTSSQDGSSGFGSSQPSQPSSQSSQPSLSTGFTTPPVSPSTPAVAEPVTDEPALAQPAPEVAPQPTADQPLAAPVVPVGYSYPAVWLLPLALALAAIALGRSLTGEVEVLADDAPRDLIGRLWLALFPNREPAS